MDCALDGRVALITGASSGIGAAVARTLAVAGVSVSLIARRTERLEQVRAQVEQLGGTATVVSSDLRQPDEPRRVVARTREELGPVDILVNNAAAVRLGPVGELSPNRWDLQIALNLTVPYLLSRELLPDLRARRGWIVNISSALGLETLPQTGAYAVSKNGLNTLTELLWLENRDRGVRAVAVCPGWVNTEQSPSDLERFGVFREDLLEPDDVAQAVLWVLTRPPRVSVGPVVHLSPTSGRADTRAALSVQSRLTSGSDRPGSSTPNAKKLGST